MVGVQRAKAQENYAFVVEFEAENYCCKTRTTGTAAIVKTLGVIPVKELKAECTGLIEARKDFERKRKVTVRKPSSTKLKTQTMTQPLLVKSWKFLLTLGTIMYHSWCI